MGCVRTSHNKRLLYPGNSAFYHSRSYCTGSQNLNPGCEHSVLLGGIICSEKPRQNPMRGSPTLCNPVDKKVWLFHICSGRGYWVKGVTGRTIQDIQGQDTVTWPGSVGSPSWQDETNPELILAASVISDQKYLKIRRSGDENARVSSWRNERFTKQGNWMRLTRLRKLYTV